MCEIVSQYATIPLVSGQDNYVQLNIPSVLGWTSLDLTAYQFTGVAVPAGVPYSLAFYAGVSGETFQADTIVTWNGSTAPSSPNSGISGIPLPLTSSYTTVQYDTPRVFARRVGMAVTGSSPSLVIRVVDDTGAFAQFTAGRLYLNVNRNTVAVDITKAVTRNHRLTFVEHI